MMKDQGQLNRKHIPERTCVVCRTKADKRSLTRVIRGTDHLMIDATGKMNGRGAYLCNNPACWEKAIKSNVLDRALNMTLTDQDRNCLQQALLSS
jgi:predicted RNA-binding protein YlxR (DUF448 family)